jgi:uncharacterized membrane protein YgcG
VVPCPADAVLADPMCGSAALLIEAALIATHTAPGLLRNALVPPSAAPWPFTSWPDHHQRLWEEVLEEARDVTQLPVDMLGNKGARSGSSRQGGGRSRHAGGSSRHAGGSSRGGSRRSNFRILGNDIHGVSG